MKKSIAISAAVLGTIGSVAFAWSDPRDPVPASHRAMRNVAAVPFDFSDIPFLKDERTEIFFDMGSRFMINVTKETLQNARTIHDIYPDEPERALDSYSSVSIRVVKDERQMDIVEMGSGPELTAAQRELLRSMDYSSSFLIRSEFTEKNSETGTLEENYSSPHITVVPEKQAVNTSGKDALIAYVKDNTKEFSTIVKADKLQPGKVYFTVTEAGSVVHVRVSLSSGYPALDQRVIELIEKLPGTWEPARNAAGEKVDQEYVLSYGMVGC